MSGLYTFSASEMHISRNEAFRYLGGTGLPDSTSETLIEEAVAELEGSLAPNACYMRFPTERLTSGELNLGFARISSEMLSKNLEGCGECFLFAATVGIGADRLIRKYSHLSQSKAAALQAVSAAAVEGFCDAFCGHLRECVKTEGKRLRPRFSPGYGDLPLSLQSDILRTLDAEKHCGITLTDGGLMVPTKSVTGIIGILG